MVEIHGLISEVIGKGCSSLSSIITVVSGQVL